MSTRSSTLRYGLTCREPRTWCIKSCGKNIWQNSNFGIFEKKNQYRHILWNCLPRCVNMKRCINMKWMWKMQSGHDSVQRWTDWQDRQMDKVKPVYPLQIHLTHWGRDKMVTIYQTTFWNAFSWMKMYKFWLRFHWILFLRVQSTIFQHWFR